jgi:hypothetical protein
MGGGGLGSSWGDPNYDLVGVVLTTDMFATAFPPRPSSRTTGPACTRASMTHGREINERAVEAEVTDAWHRKPPRRGSMHEADLVVERSAAIRDAPDGSGRGANPGLRLRATQNATHMYDAASASGTGHRTWNTSTLEARARRRLTHAVALNNLASALRLSKRLDIGAR